MPGIHEMSHLPCCLILSVGWTSAWLRTVSLDGDAILDAQARCEPRQGVDLVLGDGNRPWLKGRSTAPAMAASDMPIDPVLQLRV